MLVIGGGITGAGIARDAALRGLAVALIERNDFASGTSSRSSRLIHGGLRYLEHGYLRLVHESSRERRLLLKLAPHLVRPLAFTWPVYRGARVPRWKLRAGLYLYDALAMFRNVRRHRGLSGTALLEREPAVRSTELLGGATYYDAATDDCRLTLANAIAASEAGVVVNHVNVESLIVSHGKVAGVEARDTRTGERISVGARVVVNATGPWSDDVRALAGERTARGVRGSKGTHISVRSKRVGNRAALTLLSPVDGRVFFVLPSGARTIIGTTDTFSDDSPDDVHASESDVSYLLKSANYFFPKAELTIDDVEAAWAGLRPLVAGAAGGGEGSASREHAITVSTSGLVTITGGKLTTYRSMAAEIVDTVQKRLGKNLERRSTTHTLKLPGASFESLDDEIGSASLQWDADTARSLVEAYGSNWRAIAFDAAKKSDRIEDGLPYVMAQLDYSVANEMACTLGDLLIRRTHVAFETRDHGASAAERVARRLRETLGWSDDQVARELADYRVECDRMFSVR